jgi:hypothetical protein
METEEVVSAAKRVVGTPATLLLATVVALVAIEKALVQLSHTVPTTKSAIQNASFMLWIVIVALTHTSRAGRVDTTGSKRSFESLTRATHHFLAKYLSNGVSVKVYVGGNDCAK